MTFTTRPVLMGTNGMVASTHYLASQAGLCSLKRGGNAVDAGATMWFCLTILEPHRVGVAGESPILIYSADEERVIAVNGQGPAPKATTVDWFKEHDYNLIPPDGFLPAVVPGAFDAWIKALSKYGTMTLREVLHPAAELAAKGFPVYPEFRKSLAEENMEAGLAMDGKMKVRPPSTVERFLNEWHSSAEIYLHHGQVPQLGQIVSNTQLARTFEEVMKVEDETSESGREAGLKAVRDYFYQGPIADRIVSFMQTFKCRDIYGKENHGLLSLEDFSSYDARFEEAVTINYRGHDVYKCGPWTQGPVLLQQLNLLEGFDLRQMGHNTVEYLHVLIECAKLAFADREQYYADPDYVKVPLKKLLSKDYADNRRKLVDLHHASVELRPGEKTSVTVEEKGSLMRHSEADTVHLEVVDRFGNMVSATPSGAWISASPIIPGLGFCMNTRAQMFHLDTTHVERLEPGRKPSTTLSPSLVMKEEKPYMTFGTPGGDQQDQWTLQFFLNHTDFDMNIQLALDAPTVHSTHFPSSFWPHASQPGVIHVEPGVSKEVIRGLKNRGHKVIVDDPWSHGQCLALLYNVDTGVISGGASPRGMKAYAIGW